MGIKFLDFRVGYLFNYLARFLYLFAQVYLCFCLYYANTLSVKE